MFGFAWLTLRQARHALRTGQLEEASRLLDQPAMRDHRNGNELRIDLAKAYVERGEARLSHDEIEQAWADLLEAERLGTAFKHAERLRQALSGLGLAQLRAQLTSGDVHLAEETVARLRQHEVTSIELGVLEEGLRGWVRAKELAGRGELPLALEVVAGASRLLGVNPRLEAFHEDLRRLRQRLPEMVTKLHEAAAHDRGQEVVELAEEILAVAPQHPEARAMRARAWRNIGTTMTHAGTPAEAEENHPAEPPPRFLLWIDGVGGYLVCLGNRLTFGQALPGARVDVPIVADVSRLHASLSRDGEGYVLEAIRPVQVNGSTHTRVLLRPGDRVTLGATCQFFFRLPVPASTTARLEMASGHRLPVAVSGVLLMAETLILADSPEAHVTIPGLATPVVLFRHKNGLGLRHKGEMRVNGQLSTGKTILPPHATVSGADVSFAVEPAG